MSEYIKYQHVEKLGSTEVEGILLGDVYIFPKIDGTNAHIWNEGGDIHYGSRHRELSLENDNAGFMNAMVKDLAVQKLCNHLCPGAHVYGEWLVPHSLKTYEDTAWRQFYVFDITFLDRNYQTWHMHYDELSVLCHQCGVNYIPPLKVIHNPTEENITRELENNKFLITDGRGVGEGVVLKNYEYRNTHGRQTWAKVVTNEFKTKHIREMGAPTVKGTSMVEETIVNEYVTQSLVEKTHAKISVANAGWGSKMIPQLLGTVLHDLVVEHTWDAYKKFKAPTINFKTLRQFCDKQVKLLLPEVF